MNKQRLLDAADWADIDNTVIGCCRRMRLLANEGLPTNFWEQMKGRDPLGY
jgi:hypothetical protein